ncbi:MAG: family 1 glycosylhydrolase, partial [Planctomycetota bacterium]
LVPALTGAYDPLRLRELGPDAPHIADGDLAIINQPLDALGLNVYFGVYVEPCACERGYRCVDYPAGYPHMDTSWLNVVPSCVYWGPRLVAEALGRRDLPVFISENGCACPDTLSPDGRVHDLDRIFYLRQHFRQAHRAVTEGYALEGYFVWSFMDNFEWAEGYAKRFGITYVDYETQRRIPKDSFRWYQQVLRENRVV